VRLILDYSVTSRVVAGLLVLLSCSSDEICSFAAFVLTSPSFVSFLSGSSGRSYCQSFRDTFFCGVGLKPP
jgi:hypothetical protein